MKKVLLAVLLLSGIALGQGGTQVATDNFTRSNGSLGSNWTVDAGTWAISSNTATVSTATSGSPARYNNVTISADHCSGIKVASYSVRQQVAAVRMGAGNKNFYGMICFSNSGATCTGVGVYKWVGGAKDAGSLGGTMAWASQSITSTDEIKVCASGSTISAYKNTTLLGSVTDTTYTTGLPGMGGNSTFTSTNGITFWEAIELGLTPASAPTFSPASPVLDGTVVTMTTTSSGCSGSIKYTTDGTTTPDATHGTTGTTYTVTTGVTLKAAVVGCSGFSSSPTSTQAFTIATPDNSMWVNE